MLSFGLTLLAEINKWRLGEYPLAVLYFHRVLEHTDPFCLMIPRLKSLKI